MVTEFVTENYSVSLFQSQSIIPSPAHGKMEICKKNILGINFYHIGKNKFLTGQLINIIL